MYVWDDVKDQVITEMPQVWVFSASEVAPAINIIAIDDVFFVEYLFGETNIANIRKKPSLGAPDYICV